MIEKSFRLPGKLNDELKTIADEEGVDQSELVRWGLVMLFRSLRQNPLLVKDIVQELKNLEDTSPPAP